MGVKVIKSNIYPPAASTTAWAAAVSHSLVGPKRGYKSILPSATMHDFKELPKNMISWAGSCARNAEKSADNLCEWLAAMRNISCSRRKAQLIGIESPSSSLRQNAPKLRTPNTTNPLLGHIPHREQGLLLVSARYLL